MVQKRRSARRGEKGRAVGKELEELGEGAGEGGEGEEEEEEEEGVNSKQGRG